MRASTAMRSVAGSAAFPFDLTVPGGQVKAAGVTVVGVLPTHRRRGYLRAMKRSLIDDARARGEPVAVLWATEDTIYGQFGYGMASMAAEIDRAARARGAVRAQSTCRARRGSCRSTRPSRWSRRSTSVSRAKRPACSRARPPGGRTGC